MEKEAPENSNPYLFSVLLTILFVAVSFTLGSLTGVLGYPTLAIIGAIIVTKKRWWKKVGFTLSGANGRSLLLSVPVFLPVLWWLAAAPIIGYGTLQIPELGTLGLILGFTLLVGFTEEMFFRGIMLQALRPKGAWTAILATSLLFGAAHAVNAFAASPVYTALQVGYAVPLGLSFAAVVWVTRLIWPVVLAHGLIDFGAYLNSAAGGAVSTTVTEADYLLTAVIIAVYTTYAVLLVRRGIRTPAPASN